MIPRLIPSNTTATQSASSRMPWWLSVLAAGFAPVVAIQTTLDLYRGNAAHLTLSDVPVLAISATCLISWGLLFVALHWGRGIGKVVWAIPCAYAASFLIRDVAFPLSLCELDGTAPLAAPSLAYVALELFTFAVIFALLVFPAQKRTAPIFAILMVAFASSIVLTTASALARSARVRRPFAGPDQAEALPVRGAATRLAEQPHLGRRNKASRTAGQSSLAGDSEIVSTQTEETGQRRPNVYHILFDTYQGSEHEIAREMRGASPYDDFIFFKNNIANYNTTFMSLPSLMTSSHYTPTVELNQWARSYKQQGLLARLKQLGYNVEIFGYSSSWWNTPYADYVRCTRDIASEILQSEPPRFDEFLALVKLRCLPSFVAAKLFPDPCGGAAFGDVRSPPISASAYYCTVKFREMTAGVRHTRRCGNYTFLHMILPHPPLVMDEHGQYGSSH